MNLQLSHLGILSNYITLHNTEINASAINALLPPDSPVHLTRGVVRKLRLKIPWASLLSSPVRLELEGVHCVAAAVQPGSPVHTGPQVPPAAGTPAGTAPASAPADSAGAAPGWLASKLSNLLANAEVVLRDVSVAYSTGVGTATLLLDSLTVSTVRAEQDAGGYAGPHMAGPGTYAGDSTGAHSAIPAGTAASSTHSGSSSAAAGGSMPARFSIPHGRTWKREFVDVSMTDGVVHKLLQVQGLQLQLQLKQGKSRAPTASSACVDPPPSSALTIQTVYEQPGPARRSRTGSWVTSSHGAAGLPETPSSSSRLFDVPILQKTDIYVVAGVAVLPSMNKPSAGLYGGAAAPRTAQDDLPAIGSFSPRMHPCASDGVAAPWTQFIRQNAPGSADLGGQARDHLAISALLDVYIPRITLCISRRQLHALANIAAGKGAMPRQSVHAVHAVHQPPPTPEHWRGGLPITSPAAAAAAAAASEQASKPAKGGGWFSGLFGGEAAEDAAGIPDAQFHNTSHHQGSAANAHDVSGFVLGMHIGALDLVLLDHHTALHSEPMSAEPALKGAPQLTRVPMPSGESVLVDLSPAPMRRAALGPTPVFSCTVRGTTAQVLVLNGALQHAVRGLPAVEALRTATEGTVTDACITVADIGCALHSNAVPLSSQPLEVDELLPQASSVLAWQAAEQATHAPGTPAPPAHSHPYWDWSLHFAGHAQPAPTAAIALRVLAVSLPAADGSGTETHMLDPRGMPAWQTPALHAQGANASFFNPAAVQQGAQLAAAASRKLSINPRAMVGAAHLARAMANPLGAGLASNVPGPVGGTPSLGDASSYTGTALTDASGAEEWADTPHVTACTAVRLKLGHLQLHCTPALVKMGSALARDFQALGADSMASPTPEQQQQQQQQQPSTAEPAAGGAPAASPCLNVHCQCDGLTIAVYSGQHGTDVHSAALRLARVEVALALSWPGARHGSLPGDGLLAWPQGWATHARAASAQMLDASSAPHEEYTLLAEAKCDGLSGWLTGSTEPWLMLPVVHVRYAAGPGLCAASCRPDLQLTACARTTADLGRFMGGPATLADAVLVACSVQVGALQLLADQHCLPAMRALTRAYLQSTMSQAPPPSAVSVRCTCGPIRLQAILSCQNGKMSQAGMCSGMLACQELALEVLRTAASSSTSSTSSAALSNKVCQWGKASGPPALLAAAAVPLYARGLRSRLQRALNVPRTDTLPPGGDAGIPLQQGSWNVALITSPMEFAVEPLPLLLQSLGAFMPQLPSGNDSQSSSSSGSAAVPASTPKASPTATRPTRGPSLAQAVLDAFGQVGWGKLGVGVRLSPVQLQLVPSVQLQLLAAKLHGTSSATGDAVEIQGQLGVLRGTIATATVHDTISLTSTMRCGIARTQTGLPMVSIGLDMAPVQLVLSSEMLQALQAVSSELAALQGLGGSPEPTAAPAPAPAPDLALTQDVHGPATDSSPALPCEVKLDVRCSQAQALFRTHGNAHELSVQVQGLEVGAWLQTQQAPSVRVSVQGVWVAHGRKGPGVHSDGILAAICAVQAKKLPALLISMQAGEQRAAIGHVVVDTLSIVSAGWAVCAVLDECGAMLQAGNSGEQAAPRLPQLQGSPLAAPPDAPAFQPCTAMAGPLQGWLPFPVQLHLAGVHVVLPGGAGGVFALASVQDMQLRLSACVQGHPADTGSAGVAWAAAASQHATAAVHASLSISLYSRRCDDSADLESHCSAVSGTRDDESDALVLGVQVPGVARLAVEEFHGDVYAAAQLGHEQRFLLHPAKLAFQSMWLAHASYGVHEKLEARVMSAAEAATPGAALAALQLDVHLPSVLAIAQGLNALAAEAGEVAARVSTVLAGMASEPAQQPSAAAALPLQPDALPCYTQAHEIGYGMRTAHVLPVSVAVRLQLEHDDSAATFAASAALQATTPLGLPGTGLVSDAIATPAIQALQAVRTDVRVSGITADVLGQPVLKWEPVAGGREAQAITLSQRCSMTPQATRVQPGMTLLSGGQMLTQVQLGKLQIHAQVASLQRLSQSISHNMQAVQFAPTPQRPSETATAARAYQVVQGQQDELDLGAAADVSMGFGQSSAFQLDADGLACTVRLPGSDGDAQSCVLELSAGPVAVEVQPPHGAGQVLSMDTGLADPGWHPAATAISQGVRCGHGIIRGVCNDVAVAVRTPHANRCSLLALQAIECSGHAHAEQLHVRQFAGATFVSALQTYQELEVHCQGEGIAPVITSALVQDLYAASQHLAAQAPASPPPAPATDTSIAASTGAAPVSYAALRLVAGKLAAAWPTSVGSRASSAASAVQPDTLSLPAVQALTPARTHSAWFSLSEFADADAAHGTTAKWLAPFLDQRVVDHAVFAARSFQHPHHRRVAMAAQVMSRAVGDAVSACPPIPTPAQDGAWWVPVYYSTREPVSLAFAVPTGPVTVMTPHQDARLQYKWLQGPSAAMVPCAEQELATPRRASRSPMRRIRYVLQVWEAERGAYVTRHVGWVPLLVLSNAAAEPDVTSAMSANSGASVEYVDPDGRVLPHTTSLPTSGVTAWRLLWNYSQAAAELGFPAPGLPSDRAASLCHPLMHAMGAGLADSMAMHVQARADLDCAVRLTATLPRAAITIAQPNGTPLLELGIKPPVVKFGQYSVTQGPQPANVPADCAVWLKSSSHAKVGLRIPDLALTLTHAATGHSARLLHCSELRAYSAPHTTEHSSAVSLYAGSGPGFLSPPAGTSQEATTPTRARADTMCSSTTSIAALEQQVVLRQAVVTQLARAQVGAIHAHLPLDAPGQLIATAQHICSPCITLPWGQLPLRHYVAASGRATPLLAVENRAQLRALLFVRDELYATIPGGATVELPLLWTSKEHAWSMQLAADDADAAHAGPGRVSAAPLTHLLNGSQTSALLCAPAGTCMLRCVHGRVQVHPVALLRNGTRGDITLHQHAGNTDQIMPGEACAIQCPMRGLQHAHSLNFEADLHCSLQGEAYMVPRDALNSLVAAAKAHQASVLALHNENATRWQQVLLWLHCSVDDQLIQFTVHANSMDQQDGCPVQATWYRSLATGVMRVQIEAPHAYRSDSSDGTEAAVQLMLRATSGGSLPCPVHVLCGEPVTVTARLAGWSTAASDLSHRWHVYAPHDTIRSAGRALPKFSPVAAVVAQGSEGETSVRAGAVACEVQLPFKLSWRALATVRAARSLPVNGTVTLKIQPDSSSNSYHLSGHWSAAGVAELWSVEPAARSERAGVTLSCMQRTPCGRLSAAHFGCMQALRAHGAAPALLPTRLLQHATAAAAPVVALPTSLQATALASCMDVTLEPVLELSCGAGLAGQMSTVPALPAKFDNFTGAQLEVGARWGAAHEACTATELAEQETAATMLVPTAPPDPSLPNVLQLAWTSPETGLLPAVLDLPAALSIAYHIHAPNTNRCPAAAWSAPVLADAWQPVRELLSSLPGHGQPAPWAGLAQALAMPAAGDTTCFLRMRTPVLCRTGGQASAPALLSSALLRVSLQRDHARPLSARLHWDRDPDAPASIVNCTDMPLLVQVFAQGTRLPPSSLTLVCPAADSGTVLIPPHAELDMDYSLSAAASARWWSYIDDAMDSEHGASTSGVSASGGGDTPTSLRSISGEAPSSAIRDWQQLAARVGLQAGSMCAGLVRATWSSSGMVRAGNTEGRRAARRTTQGDAAQDEPAAMRGLLPAAASLTSSALGSMMFCARVGAGLLHSTVVADMSPNKRGEPVAVQSVIPEVAWASSMLALHPPRVLPPAPTACLEAGTSDLLRCSASKLLAVQLWRSGAAQLSIMSGSPLPDFDTPHFAFPDPQCMPSLWLPSISGTRGVLSLPDISLQLSYPAWQASGSGQPSAAYMPLAGVQLAGTSVSAGLAQYASAGPAALALNSSTLCVSSDSVTVALADFQHAHGALSPAVVLTRTPGSAGEQGKYALLAQATLEHLPGLARGTAQQLGWASSGAGPDAAWLTSCRLVPGTLHVAFSDEQLAAILPALKDCGDLALPAAVVLPAGVQGGSSARVPSTAPAIQPDARIALAQFYLGDLNIIANVQVSKPVSISLRDMALNVAALHLSRVALSQPQLVTVLTAAVAADAVLALPGIVGSLDWLGNPAAIVAAASKGVARLFERDAEASVLKRALLAATDTGGALVRAVGAASAVVARNMRAVSSAPGQPGSSSVNWSATELPWQASAAQPAMAAQYWPALGARRTCIQPAKPAQGQERAFFSAALSEMGGGVWRGLSGVVTQPWAGRGSVGGLLRGVGSGVLGTVAQPLAAVASVVALGTGVPASAAVGGGAEHSAAHWAWTDASLACPSLEHLAQYALLTAATNAGDLAAAQAVEMQHGTGSLRLMEAGGSNEELWAGQPFPADVLLFCVGQAGQPQATFAIVHSADFAGATAEMCWPPAGGRLTPDLATSSSTRPQLACTRVLPGAVVAAVQAGSPWTCCFEWQGLLWQLQLQLS